MKRETVSYEGDGLSLRGELFFEPADHLQAGGQAGPRPGVLVFPEAFGLSAHAIERAESLARLGYVAMACDLHGNAKLIDDLDAAIGALKPLFAEPDRTRARAGGALDAIAARPEVDESRIAAIGFCFGGTMALELARGGADIRAAVGFHSGLGTATPPENARNIRGRVLVCIGADDPMIPPEQRLGFEEEMRGAKVDWQLLLLGNAVHGFTNKEAAKRGMPDAIRYSPEADRRSWAAMQALFAEVLG